MRLENYKKVDKISLKLALKNAASPQKFSFPKAWTLPCVLLKLEAEQLEMLNVTFFVAEADLSAKKLLIHVSALQRLVVEHKTLLEQISDILDGFDCSSIDITGAIGRGKYFSQLMMAQTNRANEASINLMMV